MDEWIIHVSTKCYVSMHLKTVASCCKKIMITAFYSTQISLNDQMMPGDIDCTKLSKNSNNLRAGQT